MTNKEKRESFVFYRSWWEILKDEDQKVQWEVISAVNEYVFNDNLIDLRPKAQMAFKFIKRDIDRASENYNSLIEKNRENGKKGGAPKGNQNAKKQPKTTQTTQTTQNKRNKPNDNDNDNVNDNINKKEKYKKEKPPLSVFLDYALSKKPNVNQGAVELKYHAWVENGWKTGKDKVIKNWKTTLLNTLPHLPEAQKQKSKYSVM